MAQRGLSVGREWRMRRALTNSGPPIHLALIFDAALLWSAPPPTNEPKMTILSPNKRCAARHGRVLRGLALRVGGLPSIGLRLQELPHRPVRCRDAQLLQVGA